PGSSDAAIRASILLVRRKGLRMSDFGFRVLALPLIRHPALALALALGCPSDFLLQRAPRHSGSALGLGRGLFARRPLQFLSFRSVRYLFCIHQSLFSPAYFSMIFFSPYPGKCTVSLASSPSPSRRTTTPRPYFGWSTDDPDFLGAAGLAGLG